MAGSNKTFEEDQLERIAKRLKDFEQDVNKDMLNSSNFTSFD